MKTKYKKRKKKGDTLEKLAEKLMASRADVPPYKVSPLHLDILRSQLSYLENETNRV